MAADEYLSPANYVDSADPEVVRFAEEAVAGISGEKARALALYYAVRDRISYNPYVDYGKPATYRASDVLKAGEGFCVGKAALLAACARAAGIAARPGYADVRNHITSKKLHDLIQTDVFHWHSYTELFIDGKWVKCTPAFDAALCARAKLAPLEFDGDQDSLFQPYDPAGRRHMEYLQDRGAYADVPAETIISEFRRLYPKFFASDLPEGDFKEDVAASSAQGG
ncbi:MAG TPA: transglutaminase family protein [Xanthobacteraceae bacterium]|nr:transglutaminase family protein [Xanthobacteraceae bacterium]